MLRALRYGMVIITFMVLIMTRRRMLALVALALVPIAFGLVAASPDAIGKMLTFSILYFNIMRTSDTEATKNVVVMVLRLGAGHAAVRRHPVYFSGRMRGTT
ncbi:MULTISPECIES: hypothetical protein [Giesbergeria]|uniref:Uncharacterized protein n=1 Tax=Giesbergeria sinuosa TaxID=80883 RepID=A0ABV9QDE2_9BURK